MFHYNYSTFQELIFSWTIFFKFLYKIHKLYQCYPITGAYSKGPGAWVRTDGSNASGRVGRTPPCTPTPVDRGRKWVCAAGCSFEGAGGKWTAGCCSSWTWGCSTSVGFQVIFVYYYGWVCFLLLTDGMVEFLCIKCPTMWVFPKQSTVN